MSAGRHAWGTTQQSACNPADPVPDARSTRRTGRHSGTPSAVSKTVEFIQINLQHNKAATALLNKSIAEKERCVILVEEPWVNKKRILGLKSKDSFIHVYQGCSSYIPRACVVTKGLQAYCLPQYCTRNQTVVCIKYKRFNKEQTLIAASVYMPIEENLPSPGLERLLFYSSSNNTPILLGCDTNHFRWSSRECNNRGVTLSEFLASTDLEVLNQGSRPTFCVGNKRTIIDVTFASKLIAREIHNWRVLPEDSFSDHRKIYFAIKQDKQPTVRRRSVKNTNWDAFEDELNAKVGLWIGRVNTPTEIEASCPLRKCGRRAKVPWWNHELKKFRQKANKAFHTAYRNSTSQDWESHRAAKREFKKALQRSKRASWLD